MLLEKFIAKIDFLPRSSFRKSDEKLIFVLSKVRRKSEKSCKTYDRRNEFLESFLNEKENKHIKP